MADVLLTEPESRNLGIAETQNAEARKPRKGTRVNP